MAKKDGNRYGYSGPEFKAFKRHAWIYLLMFSLLYCFLYCSRVNISSAQPYLLEDGWTESTIGILTGTLFWTYGIGQLVNGRLSELVGPSKFLIGAVVLSAAANFLVATQSANSVVILAVIWGANGFFQSMGWTPGLAVLTKWWPRKTRGFATGFANAFSGFGQVAALGAVLAAYAWAPNLGWKAAFIIPPCFSLVVLVVYLLLVKPSPAKAGLRDYQEEDVAKSEEEKQMQEIVARKGALYPYKYVICNWKFIIWGIIAFGTGLVRYGLSTWIPKFFMDSGFSSVDSVTSSMIFPIGMGIGTLIVPWLTDRFCPKNRMPAAIISAVLCAAATVAIYMLDASSSVQLILIEVLLFIAGFFIYAINGIVFTYAADAGGRVFSGTYSGVLNFMAYLGAAVQAVVYGFILENGGWNIVFFSIAAFSLLIAVFGFIGSSIGKSERK